jgi:L-erythrulose 1-phosphate isomerase
VNGSPAPSAAPHGPAVGRSSALNEGPARRDSTVWIGTSWKMNKTIAEGRDYVDQLTRDPIPPGVRPFVLPPHTALAAVRQRLPDGSPIRLGAQNAHWAAEGAGTGEVSMRMVKDAGAVLVEMGHSERREQFGETDETVALKARAAVDHGLTPLICVGEPAPIRAAGRAEEYVLVQIRAATSILTTGEVAGVLVAYEPIWAIGSGGRPATPAEVAPVMAVLAVELSKRSAGLGCAGLLYGGGVDPQNALALLRDAPADGLFVGRAGWSPDGLRRLIDIGAAHEATRRD